MAVAETLRLKFDPLLLTSPDTLPVLSEPIVTSGPSKTI